MSNRLTIRPEAEADIAEAFDWYEEQVLGLGSDFLLCLDAVLNEIRRNPLLYSQIHRETRRALVRRFPYQILYLYIDKTITLIAVFHAKRNPKIWKKRL